jgi:hypothetical protein
LEKTITDLLPVADIQVFGKEGLTDHFTAQAALAVLAVATKGSPLFTVERESVKAEPALALLFFLQDAAASKIKHPVVRVRIVRFTIIASFFQLTGTRNYSLHSGTLTFNYLPVEMPIL